MARSFARRESDAIVRFVLGPPRHGWQIALSVVGLAFFTHRLSLGIGLASSSSALFSAVALALSFAALAYQFLGEELIEIGADEVKVRRTLFDLPVLRTASYALDTLHAQFVPAGEGGRRFNRIEMRVAGQQTWIAYAIEQPHADEIVLVIAARKAGGAIPGGLAGKSTR
jgi:hypothetical protein